MSKTVLVIEDNVEMRENIAELLSLAEYNVLTASNGKEGLEVAKTSPPHLILCDIMMPELDGYGVLRVIESLPALAGIPFVFLTAKSERSDFRKAMDLGADDYLTKPFEGDELLRVVEGRLKKSQLLKKEFSNNLKGLDEFVDVANKLMGTDILKEPRTVKKLRKKDTIFMEGDSANHLYFVVSGKIKTYRTNEWGKEYITDILKEGDFFGYVSLFDDMKRKESAIAIEDAEVALMTRQDFHKLLYSNNEIAVKFIHLMSNNLNEAEQRLLKLAYNSARKRVAESLLFISKKYDANEKDAISITRENISSIAGIAPESVSRNLGDFKEEGLIEIENGNIKIINQQKLANLKC